MTGFECNAGMVARGRALAESSGLPVRFVEARPDEAPQLGTFDGAIVGWGVYGHIIGQAQRLEFLRAVREQMRPGGPVLVSAQHTLFVTRAQRITAAVGSFIRRARRSREPVEVGDQIHDYYFHLFTPGAMAGEIASAGFDVVYVDHGLYLNIVALRA